MESDDFTKHYIIRYLSAREFVLPPLIYHCLMLAALSKEQLNLCDRPICVHCILQMALAKGGSC